MVVLFSSKIHGRTNPEFVSKFLVPEMISLTVKTSRLIFFNTILLEISCKHYITSMKKILTIQFANFKRH